MLVELAIAWSWLMLSFFEEKGGKFKGGGRQRKSVRWDPPISKRARAR